MKFLLSRDDPGFRNQMFEIRKSLEMNRVDFAKLCNIPRANIRRYEDVNVLDKCLPREANWNSIKEALDKINYFNEDIKVLAQNNRSGLRVPHSSFKTMWQPVTPYCETLLKSKDVFTVETVSSELEEYPKFKNLNWINAECKIRIRAEFSNLTDASKLYREMKTTGLIVIRNWVE